MNPNDYLTTAEAAAAVGVSLREIQRKINAGILPATKRGGIWFIARDDLEAARASHERGPGRPAADATLRAIGVEVVDAADSRPYRATPAGIAAAARVRQQQAEGADND